VRLWRRAANSHRCIVPVSGYYEWQRTIDGKQPWYFQRPGGAVMGLAGIWEPGPAPHHFDTYAVLTIAPNDAVKHIHDRMPLILPGSAWHDWMGASPLEKVAHLMVIPPSETLTMHRVSRMVGNAASEGPELIRPLTSPPPPGGLFGQP
jgi:putative SOS response-associated peptidase YedK